MDQTRLSFLDLQITLENGQLCNSTFQKETAANTLLYATSHHPHWVKNGIPVGQFLRIKRNCSKASDYKREIRMRDSENEVTRTDRSRELERKAAMRDCESLLSIEPSKSAPESN